MKAPDTIYIAPNHESIIYGRGWFELRHADTDTAYVRADLPYELSKTVEAQKAEIDMLASDCNSLSLVNQELKAEIARLKQMAFLHAPGEIQFAPEGWTWKQAYDHLIHQDEADIDTRLRASLERYGAHLLGCKTNHTRLSKDCTCGFTAALKGES